LRDAIADTVVEVADGDDYTGYLKLITCREECAYVVYEYDETGDETAGEAEPGIPPEVGVPLPFPYILGGGVFLGVLLVGAGIILRRRTR
jgi:hypothetical protein